MRPHTIEGDAYSLSVTIGGELVEAEGYLPVGITGERALVALSDATVDLVRSARLAVERQWRALEAGAADQEVSDDA